MISEDLVSSILDYINFNGYSKFLDLQSYHLDHSTNDKISFEDFKTFLPLAIGINLKIFKDEYINSLTHIRILNISNCNIKILPKELFILKQLKIIDCTVNRIFAIPTEIGNCNLQEFYCSWNEITIIPSNIGKLINLQKFNCEHNEIFAIPPEIGNCVKLQIFNCSWNKITTI